MPQRGLRALGIAAVLVRLGVASAAAQTFEVVHAFRSGGDPRSILLRASDGYFYGTTAADGTERRGSIFRMDVSGSFVTLHSFHGPDGEFPTGALIEASDGYFYGTTSGGGDSGVYGTVFRMDAAGNPTTLYSFQYGADGGFPRSGLVEASDGNFYGTTIQGGTGAYGTVFRMTPAGGLLTIHPFSGGDGSAPIAPLIQGMDGLLYGT
ncbi:MAG: choice-of-anchor tandem repeat GloVer-containing protein, partial [Thermoanaerobaculia bacterium]